MVTTSKSMHREIQIKHDLLMTMLTNTPFDFNNVLVNVEQWKSIVNSYIFYYLLFTIFRICIAGLLYHTVFLGHYAEVKPLYPCVFTACESAVTLLFDTVMHLGCKPYLDSQRSSCICRYEEKADL